MRIRFFLICTAIAVAVAVGAPMFLSSRLTLVITAAIYFPIVLGISALAGHANQVSAGHAAFFGTSAYVTGVLSSSGVNGWTSMLAGTVASVLLAVLIGIPVLRLRGHFLVLATISLNIIFVVLVKQLSGITGGSSGLMGIQPLEIFGTPIISYQAILYLAILWALISAVGTHNLLNSAVGRALKTLGASEPAAASVGVSQSNYATILFAWSALLAGGSGAIYAEWMKFLSPGTFDIHLSIVLLLMAVIGGVGSIGGAALAVVVYLSLSEVLNVTLSPVLGALSPVIEGLTFGLLLLVLVILRPGGLASFFPRWKKKRTEIAGAAVEQGAEALGPEAVASQRGGADESRQSGALVLSDISHSFGGIRVLEGVDLQVEQGEILALVGPNGAGKSTLLNIVSGLLRPTSGRVEYGDATLTGLSSHNIARHSVSRSFQTPQLVPSMPVVDNVAVGMHRYFSSPKKLLSAIFGTNVKDETRINTRARSILQTTQPDFRGWDMSIGSLPFGDRRWVELARATASNPNLILLDEPASGLTEGERDHLIDLIQSYARTGATVVIVEHDMDLVRRVAPRTVVLNQGKILADGPTTQTLDDPKVQEAYLGSLTVENQPKVDRAESDVILQVSSLQTGYGDMRVIDDADLVVYGNEITAIFGPNGAGKSTLIRAITGQLKFKGEVELASRKISGERVDALAREGLVLVPEGRELIPGLSVLEHLKLSGAANRGAVQDPFELSDVYSLFPILKSRSLQRATSLSGGQQQMLAIARALLMQPKLLIVDEPLLGLSPMAAQEVLAALRQLANDGLAVVLAEQQERTVRPYVDRVLYIDHGVLSEEEAVPSY